MYIAIAALLFAPSLAILHKSKPKTTTASLQHPEVIITAHSVHGDSQPTPDVVTNQTPGPVEVPIITPEIEPKKEFGVSINGLNGKTEAQIKAKFDDIAQLGFTQVRIDFPWYRLQPHNAQTYTWGEYDKIVKLALQAKLKVLGIIGYTPEWARRPECKDKYACPPANNGQFAAFAGATATHFRDSVHQWEVWNEENANNFWPPYSNARQYAELLKVTYPAIKAKNPNAKVIIGGMVASSKEDAKSQDPIAFLTQIYVSGGKGNFDAVGYHPYTFPSGATENSNAWLKMTANKDNLLSVMQANGDGDKQIWMTEYGAPTNGPRGSIYVSEDRQAQLAAQAFAAVQDRTWAGPLFWYGYQDPSNSLSTKENFYGFKRADGQPKPAYQTWQSLLKK